ncbi:MAG: DUF4388 domain-containing protein [Myxococcota bacterium]
MSGSVLIADDNSERGERVASACTDRGFATRAVPHGAAALEAALATLPDVLVVRRDLPLIDGTKLGEILRTNPRTQSLQLLCIDDRATEGETGPGELQVISASASPDDVAETVRAMFERREKDQAADAEHARDAGGGVEGELVQIPLGDLLQLFHVSRKTGVVELLRRDRSGDRETGSVVVSAGDVVHASVGSADGEKAFFRLIAWETGSFTFRPQPVLGPATVTTPTLTLLREGRRQLDEWQRLAVRLPPMDAHVTLKIHSASLPKVIHPLTQDVLQVLEEHTRVGDVVDHCAHPDFQVLRMLHTLIRRGMLSLRRDVPGPDGAPTRAGLFSPNQASRLREWLDFDGPGEGGACDAKLVVAAASPEASREFARVMSRLPGVTFEEEAAGGDVSPDVIGTLGRIAVDTEVGIEFVQVPIAEAFRPLWSVAANGALAVLLLLAGPLSEAADAIQPLAAEMGKLPRSRVFHLQLLEKGQGLSPETLRENISLLDESSLFLVPLENADKAGLLLREMFGRILP